MDDYANDTREFEVRDQLEKMRKDIHSFDELVDFLKYVKDNCNTGYGTAPRSIAQAALAVAWYFSGDFGITGFQAGVTMWDFIKDWAYPDNKCGLKIVDYDNMLYPQYEYKFNEHTIPEYVWEELQKTAKENLDNFMKDRNNYTSNRVLVHWSSIANDGVVPFGYKVKEYN